MTDSQKEIVEETRRRMRNMTVVSMDHDRIEALGGPVKCPEIPGHKPGTIRINATENITD